jgi:hypothetical protein
VNLRSTGFLASILIGIPFGTGETVRTADCNGNGIEDAADLLPGNFDLLAQGTHAVGLCSNSLISADFNGDSKPDIAAADLCSQTISLLFNHGDGTFSDATGNAVDLRPFSAIAVDINDDGSLDLATYGDSVRFIGGAVSVLLNMGDGTFRAAVSYSVGTRPLALIAVDLNGDGKPELASSNDSDAETSPYVSVLMNHGDGTFQPAVNYEGAGGSLFASDFNVDGHPDLITNGLVFINNGDGTLAEAMAFDWSLSVIADLGGIRDNLGRTVIAAADLNGDGTPDLATAGGEILLNNGDGTFQAATNYPGNGVALIAADLNCDGNIDLAAASEGVSVFLNRGDATFSDTLSYPMESGSFSLIASDLNGDGHADLAAVGHPSCANRECNPSLVSVLLNLTTPPFSLDLNQDSIPDECETLFHRGDPNSSGATDISDALSIFAYLFLGSDSPTCLESADVNNSGTIDISDGIAVLNWLFGSGEEPAAPGPAPAPCGVDPDPAETDLGCEAYDACE